MDPALTFAEPGTGWRHSNMWLVPRSAEDLGARRLVHRFWAEPSYGLMGRTPDHIACVLTAFAGWRQLFDRGGARFGDHVVRFYERARRGSLRHPMRSCRLRSTARSPPIGSRSRFSIRGSWPSATAASWSAAPRQSRPPRCSRTGCSSATSRRSFRVTRTTRCPSSCRSPPRVCISIRGDPFPRSRRASMTTRSPRASTRWMRRSCFATCSCPGSRCSSTATWTSSTPSSTSHPRTRSRTSSRSCASR